MNKSRYLAVIVILFLLVPAFQLIAEEQNADQIMLADIPFRYGEDDFIRRILEKAGGREPVGLVLSGGSARAFAHIGVLRRMEEIGIVPDFIVANSMGSIVGLLYGAGFSPDQIAEIIESTDIGSLFKIKLPLKGGIIDVSRFTGLLYNYVGDIDLKDMPIPVMVLCEDLKTKRQVWIAEGDLMTVMQAAYALPVYFDPVEYGEPLLMDGGIANLVPLDTAYNYSDRVIASTAFYRNPKLNLRNPITNINVALDIGKSRTGVSQIKHYDPLLIRCNVESFSFMEFGSLPEIQAAGYTSADEMSDELASIGGAPVSDELIEVRERHRENLDLAIKRYRALESIPVLNPEAIVTTGLEIFNTPKNNMHLNDELHVTGGLDFSYGYFSAKAAAGAGVDLGLLDSVYPVIDASIQWDLLYNLRLNLAYGMSFDLSGNDDVFKNSGLFGSLYFVPLANGNFRLGLLGSGELAVEGASLPTNYLLTVGLDFTAESDPLSAVNYGAYLKAGFQLPNAADVFGLGSTAYYADLDAEIPVPGTSGMLRWDSRAFIRRPLAGDSAYLYMRDGLHTSLEPGAYSSVNSVLTSVVFSPYNFRPTIAEVFMFKNVEAGLFGELGWIEQTIWSAGVSLEMDISLIGLKPVRLSAYGAWDGTSGGLIGGIVLMP